VFPIYNPGRTVLINKHYIFATSSGNVTANSLDDYVEDVLPIHQTYKGAVITLQDDYLFAVYLEDTKNILKTIRVELWDTFNLK
jgi:hypothetical protein